MFVGCSIQQVLSPLALSSGGEKVVWNFEESSIKNEGDSVRSNWELLAGKRMLSEHLSYSVDWPMP